MTAATRTGSDEAGGHVVQFYDDDAELIGALGPWVLSGLREDASAIVIATEAHRQDLRDHLAAAGVDLLATERDGRLVLRDACDVLAAVTSHGSIDGEAFDRVIGRLVRDAAAGGTQVLAFGEVVALLWAAGDVVGAIDLERHWNELATHVPFALLCAYHSDAISDPSHADALGQVCSLHSAVVPGASGPAWREFSADVGAPRQARRFLVDALRQRGLAGDLLDDAKLVITELATNAVVHAGSPFGVTLRPLAGAVRIAVSDRSTVAPCLRAGDERVAGGRGMRIVDTLSRAWGVNATPGGKVVWAELAG